MIACEHRKTAVNGTVDLTILRGDGSPVPDVPVVVVSSTADVPIPAIAPLTDRDGRVEWSLPPGEHVLRVSDAAGAEATQRIVVRAGERTAATFRFPSAR